MGATKKESPYTEAAAWVIANSLATGLSRQEEKRFLNFVDLPPAEQALFVIRLGNKRAHLPQLIVNALPEMVRMATDLQVCDDAVQPGRNLRSEFLYLVAHGKQDEAESLLQNLHGIESLLGGVSPNADGVQSVLLYRGSFNDGSRTFFCSAPEYAWWAKDKYMLDMLLRYMNDATKAEILTRFQRIEGISHTETGLFPKPRGLDYTDSSGKRYSSPHFDFKPLLEAYERLNTLYYAYKEGNAAESTVNTNFVLEVGGRQSECPAHVLQELCHPNRSFFKKNYQTPDEYRALFDARNHTGLPRNGFIKIFKTNNVRDVNWLLSLNAKSAGLGVSYALEHGKRTKGAGASRYSYPCHIDYCAVRALDEVRTADLKQILDTLTPEENATPKAKRDIT